MRVIKSQDPSDLRVAVRRDRPMKTRKKTFFEKMDRYEWFLHSCIPAFLPRLRRGTRHRNSHWTAVAEVLEIRQLLAANALSMIKLPEFEAAVAYQSIRGQGMSVAVIDSGFDLDNPSFGADANSNGISDRITYQYDFADNDGNASETPAVKRNSGTFSHGTFVTSLIAGADRTAENAAFRGIAPSANIIALKVANNVLDSNADLVIPDYAIVSALDWVIANATTRNIVAVNMSLGSGNFGQSTFLTEFSSRFRSLSDLGVIVVAAAGNSYRTLSSDPGVAHFAADENVVAVGAVVDTAFTDTTDFSGWSQLATQQAFFSQRHERLLDVVAPGVNMVGAIEGTGFTTNSIDDGTSYASPLVAGVAVLVQQRAQQVLGRRLNTGEFRTVLQTGSSKLTDALNTDEGSANFDVNNLGFAFPLLNVEAAVYAVNGYKTGTPRAVATAPIVQLGGSGSTRTATFSWDAGAESNLFDVWVHTVTTSGTRRTVWNTLAYNPGGTAGGVTGSSVTATWNVQAGDTDQFIWWVRAWNGTPVLPSVLNHGEWSFERRLYLVGDVPVPVVPAFVGSQSQALNNIDIRFSPVPYAAVYDVEVDRIISLNLTTGQSIATSASVITGISVGQSITGTGIPAGTTVQAVTWANATTLNGVTIPAFTNVTLSNSASQTINNVSLTINRFLNATNSTSSRFRPPQDFPIGSYRVRARAINHQNETLDFSPDKTLTVVDLVNPHPVYLGTTKAAPNHIFRFTDTNPIGQYLATVLYPPAFTLSAAIAGSTTLITNASLVNLPLDALLKLDAEIIKIEERFGDPGSTLAADTIRVQRGQWGTVGVIHSSGSAISRILQETTTEPEIRFNHVLPVGTASLEIRAVSELGNNFTMVTAVTIMVEATPATPTVPVYAGPSVFSGDVAMTWTSSDTADTFVVQIQQNGATVRNLQSYAGRSISFDDLKSGFYTTLHFRRRLHGRWQLIFSKTPRLTTMI